MQKVVIYTGPMCNFCSAAKHLLNKKKISYEEINIGYVLVSGQTAIAGKGNDLLKNPDVGRLFLGG